MCIAVKQSSVFERREAATRIIDVVFKGRLQEAHHHADNGPWRVKFTAFFAGGVSEFGYQVFVGVARHLKTFVWRHPGLRGVAVA